MSKVTVAAKVELGIKEHLDRLAQNADCTTSKLVEAAINQYLGIQSGDTPLSRLDGMQDAIDQLRQQSAEFERAIAELQQWRERLKRRGL